MWSIAVIDQLVEVLNTSGILSKHDPHGYIVYCTKNVFQKNPLEQVQ